MPLWLEIILVAVAAIIFILVVGNLLVIGVTAAIAAIMARWMKKTVKDFDVFDKGNGK